MKQFRTLIMLLIGMIGITAMGSTPLMEQKQKIEIVKDFQVQAIADNVLSFQSVSDNTDAIYFQSDEALVLNNVPFFAPSINYINDVGWRGYSLETPCITELIADLVLEKEGVQPSAENRRGVRILCLQGLSTSDGLTHWNACATYKGKQYAVSLVYDKNDELIHQSVTPSPYHCSCNFD